MQTGTDVILINMPFGPLLTPSIGLGLLKAALARVGVSTTSIYFTFSYAKIIGESVYSKISDSTGARDLLGEWIFAESLFKNQSETEVRLYIEDILRPEGISQDFIDEILEARNKAEPFLEECVERSIDCGPRIVGFTSTFQQHVASLSLAKRLKAKCPDVVTVFGGANCEGAMGLETLRQFAFVDAVVSGEGDIVFPELVRRVLRGESISHLEGVVFRRLLPLLNEAATCSAAVENMDSLALPDYEEYFIQLDENRLSLPKKPALLFETSRGCWWGEKHHCTFCGLNGQTMAHRSKTARRAFDEIVALTTKHPGYPVNFVDNILDMRYFRDFIPMLAERKLGINLFYEVKANLKKDQLSLLRAAGFTSIQPGIESLSDVVLQIMRKGISTLQNIQLLKWCKEFGIRPQWNIIWGFPNEPAEEYSRMAEIVPLITHLTPPIGSSQIQIDRFSPNFNQSEQLGFKKVSAYPAYRYVYPFATGAIDNLAYFFEFEYAEPRDVKSYTLPLTQEIVKWRECHAKSHLFWLERGDRMLIWDSRPIANEPLTVLTGLKRFCYKACDTARTASHVRASWKSTSGEAIRLHDVNDALETLTMKRLMIKRGNSYLALAVDGNLHN